MIEEKQTAEKQEDLSKSAPVIGTQNNSDDLFADFDFEGLKVDINEMFKSGVYFGHQKSRRNPKMDEYIYATKNGINIIDLQKTADKLAEAMNFIKTIIASGKPVLFVGTKKQAGKIIESAAKKCGMPYVMERWLGGTFTNFEAIAKRTKFLRDGEDKMAKGEYDKYTKFERMKIGEELEKLEERMGGIKNMGALPGAIFVSSIPDDELAVKEARRVGVPIIALADTNANPTNIDYPIPANDDAVSSLKLMLAYIVKAVLEEKAISAANKNISEPIK
jgi:small subunit ribosomal protein S2